MYKFIGTILFVYTCYCCNGQYTTAMHKMYSQSVKDSFEIYISKPANYSSSKNYDVIYYCDANLKSGKELRRQITDDKTLFEKGNYLFVGIGHIGDYHVLRRRDFILPFINNGDTMPKSTDYGHVKDFYNFLTEELIPSMQASYQCSKKRTILGHSLGGLFAFYCLFQNDKTFTNYIALSPALWIDNYSIYKFNKLKTSVSQKSYLYLSAGSQETINRILPGANAMDKFLNEKKYDKLSYEFQVHSGKTHNTQVPESLKYILQHL